MIGVAIFFFLVFIFWLLFFKPKKEKFIDLTKNADYYLAKYPDLLTKPEPEQGKPNIIINITHNHLHVYPRGEEKD